MKDSVPAIVDQKGDTKVLPEDDDPWAPPLEFNEQGPRWGELSGSQKMRRVAIGISKAVALVFLLWAFICSLDFLSTSFRLVGGRQAGRVFRESELLRNPVVGLMIGVLATVLVQSSSTSTSVVVTMVGTHLLTVRHAVPIIMGANIGTSVTNTVVSLGQASDRREFRRAFAAATIHDMFNWLAVIVLLPLEVATGYLEKLTGAIMASGEWHHADGGVQKQAFLQTITKPITLWIVQLDKKVLEKLASGQLNETEEVSLLKACSKNGTRIPCGYLLERIPWSDSTLGLCLLAVSLLLLCGCLVALVKLLHSVLGGPIAALLRRIINVEPPWPYHLFTGWVAMALGCALTVLVQSSSVFTSALTPLAGMGLVSLERIYPLTLGSNIGTTATGLLAAFAAPPAALKDTLQIAFCHLFFNISGIILFYPIPATRLPIPLAKGLGEMTSRYRWFSLLYLLVMFLLLPVFVFGLSAAGPLVFAGVGGPLLLLIIIIVMINVLQRKRPSLLPLKLRDWSFLPEWMHSLDPLDRIIGHVCCCLQSERRDAPVLGLIPNQSQMNILQPVSASSSVLTLNSTCGPEYHTMNGIENCVFGEVPKPLKKKKSNNNNHIEPDWDFGGTTTSL
ncbi:sodium-dependent phosphate transport protein 2B-like [Argiope bruennichi]|uniref:Sodium-dependent phosphate transport protein like n=1 Tax=Argiope bruennichi TaxID=94029 RepID=A0A8T0FG25_ARGBR|nr:sodium-dependent phosphate transport protein 2B-like [Argiope bruennichi]KAF8788250.1 Sodium-dependent phosphate transport protein like [Argiope bruennichi]